MNYGKYFDLTLYLMYNIIWKIESSLERASHFRNNDIGQCLINLFLTYFIRYHRDTGLYIILEPKVSYVLSCISLKTLGTFIKAWYGSIYQCPNFSTNNFSLKER